MGKTSNETPECAVRRSEAVFNRGTAVLFAEDRTAAGLPTVAIKAVRASSASPPPSPKVGRQEVPPEGGSHHVGLETDERSSWGETASKAPKFVWNEASYLQLKREELPALAALLLGHRGQLVLYRPETLTGYSKELAISRQNAGDFKVSFRQGGAVVYCAIPAGHGHFIATLVCDVLMQHHPQTPVAIVLASLAALGQPGEEPKKKELCHPGTG